MVSDEGGRGSRGVDATVPRRHRSRTLTWETPEQLQDSVDEEIIDVLCQAVLMAHNRGTDIQAVINRKRLRDDGTDDAPGPVRAPVPAGLVECANILIVNSRGEVLLYLRDDDPSIPYPGQWSILGGHMDAGETPLECVVREIEEEIGLRLDPANVAHVISRVRPFGMVVHTFTTQIDLDLSATVLTEGQALKWFTRADMTATRLGFDENGFVQAFMWLGWPTVAHPRYP